MPSCSVRKCKTRKEYKMHRFPVDPIRRQKWINFCDKPWWKPTDSARICEKHFEREHFEENSKGVRKFKSTAVPTLNYIHIIPEGCNIELGKVVKIEMEKKPEPLEDAPQDIEQTDLTTEKSENELEKMKKKLLKCQISLIKEKSKNFNLIQNLKKFLSEDQIHFLSTRSGTQRPHKWSMKTIKKCLKIRLAVGINGYNVLRNEGYPIPSYRTLCYKVSNILQKRLTHNEKNVPMVLEN